MPWHYGAPRYYRDLSDEQVAHLERELQYDLDRIKGYPVKFHFDDDTVIDASPNRLELE